ncbi:MAG: winged helix-turn-helix domain-containing protein [Halioglobus sp.]
MIADFQLGDWIVRPARRVVENGETSVHIKPKPMSVLVCLAAANGAAVSRNELFDTVWPGGEVSDDTLTKCVVELRKAFGDTARDSRVIETIPKMGFRLYLPVIPLEETPLPASMSPQEALRPRPGISPKLRLAGLLLIAAVLVPGIFFSFDSARSWFTEAEKSPPQKVTGSVTSDYLEQKPSVAVLPFVNMSNDPANEYFSDGISEEILNALANTNRIPVIARTSSFQFKGQAKDIKEIGRLLSVSHVLEGSVRRAGGNVRVTVQLIDTASGVHVWSNVYQRELRDIFLLQNTITQDIVDQIGIVLGNEFATPGNNLAGAESITAHRTASIEAYDLYLKGMQMLASTDPIPSEQATGYFDRAIALDADYADAWAAKGRATHLLAWGNLGHPQIPAVVYPDAISAYRKALEIEPQHASALGWLGELLMLNDFKWAQGLQLMKQSLAINPNDAAILSKYGIYMEKMNLEGSQEILERAFHLDPFGVTPTLARANHLARAGRWQDAAVVAETVLVGNRDGYAPNSYAAMFNLGAALLNAADEHIRESRLDAAEEQVRKARLVGHPVDFSLDYMEMAIDGVRNNTRLPWAKILDRAQTEHLNRLLIYALYEPWKDSKMMVAAFDLAIEQRDNDICGVFFGPKPPRLPDADWQRMKQITGVTKFQSTR